MILLTGPFPYESKPPDLQNAILHFLKQQWTSCVFLHMMTKASFLNEYRHSCTYPVITFRKTWSKSDFSIHTVKYIGSPAEIQTSAHWNLIGRSMTASPPVLSSRSILPPPSSHCTSIPARNNSAHVSQMLFQFFTF